MNVTFWIFMVLMLLIAISLLVYPLLKMRKNSALAYKDSNLNINAEKIAELDADLNEGRIDQLFYQQAREELDRELLIDIPVESQQTASLHYTSSAKRQPVLAILLAVFLPLSTMLLYLEIGMHSASEESFLASQSQLQQQQEKPLSVEEMSNRLEAHIEKNGGSAEEWAMLGRSHKHLGRYALAANAFKVALESDKVNAQLMLEAAEVIALNNNKEFTAEARELVLKAYALEPENMNALWFVGVAEFQHENYQQAIRHLLKMLPMISSDEDVLRSVVGIIADSRNKLIAAGTKMPELETLLGIKEKSMLASSAPKTEEAASDETVTSIKVMVDVTEDVRNKFKASDLVFVYAKAQQGPRMPLAVQRMTLAELPATVVLDDSMAMVDGMTLSAFNQLEVSARVTKSGAAIAQSGDYISRIKVDAIDAAVTLNLVIDTVIP